MFGDSDLAVFFSDFGVPVVWSGQQATGIFDQATDPWSHGGAQIGAAQRTTLKLSIPYNAFTGTPAPLDAITVNGVAYTVLSLPPQPDQQIISLLLKYA